MVRVFLALELSPEIRDRLKAAQDTLRSCSARMTFVEPGNIHITVKFLGEIDERMIPLVIEAVNRIPFSPFPVLVGDVTVNNPTRPFTVWCSISDAGKCGEIFELVEEQLAPLGISREKRRFTPHATLARIKRYDPSLMPVIGSFHGKNYGTCRITGVKVKKSTLTPSGPVYEDLTEVAW